jgi:MFS family permease
MWVVFREGQKQPLLLPARRFGVAFRSPALWTLGLAHLGTLGLGQAISPWLAVFLSAQAALPMEVAAMFGSLGLFVGMVVRPLDGFLLLIRLGTGLAALGVGVLAFSGQFPWGVGLGIACVCIGSTLPYAAVFQEADQVGRHGKFGPGTAQGVVSFFSSPASALGPALIGWLLTWRGNFSFAFAVLAAIGLVAVIAAWLVGPLLVRSKEKMRAGKQGEGTSAWTAVYFFSMSGLMTPETITCYLTASFRLSRSHPPAFPV